MCDGIQKKSSFYNDEELNREAKSVLASMKTLRERRVDELMTVKLPNGVIVSTTNPEKLKQYEEYCKRKTGYHRKP